MALLISWFFNFIAVCGAIEGSKKKVNAGLMNFFFSINNVFSIFYFVYLKEWSFLILSSVFLILSIRGMSNYWKNKKNEKKEKIKEF